MVGTERFKMWRQSRGLSQAEVAARLGIHQTHVSHIEGGKRRPNVDVAVAIERETADWPEGPIRVSEWVRLEETTEGADAPNEAA